MRCSREFGAPYTLRIRQTAGETGQSREPHDTKGWGLQDTNAGPELGRKSDLKAMEKGTGKQNCCSKTPKLYLS